MQSTTNINESQDFWSPGFRLAVFALAATSIWSLLIEFTGWFSMRSFTVYVSLPVVVILVALAL